MKKKLAIFDLDGTLFDTKDVNFSAYFEAITKAGFEVDIDYDFYCKFCNGSNYKDFLPKIVNGITFEKMEEIHEYKKIYYPKYLNKARKNESLFSLIESIKNDYYIALVTVASKKNSFDILETFDVKNVFELIIAKDDVIKTKPNPECFIQAMKYFNIDADNTIIFEDSETGLEAARLSKANYIKVFGYN